VLARLDHTGFAVAELEGAIELFRDTLGARVGPIFEDPIQRVRLCFAEYDGGRVELIAPLGPDSPVDAIVANGGGAYHLCFQTDDLDAEFERLRAKALSRRRRPQPASPSAADASYFCTTAWRSSSSVVEQEARR